MRPCLVTSTKSTSIKSSELVVVVATVDQVLHRDHFTSTLPQGSTTEMEPLILPLRSEDAGEALLGQSPGKKSARMKDLYWKRDEEKRSMIHWFQALERKSKQHHVHLAT
uniref:uncharacterized protein LOC105349929 n=1 Tax=Fragaria vesca subsp. vesca TaxID=101020 RepID=UPI0005CB5095|nr:PREDICTED: uncharacterized protein LOC105349929 [Fragaria vesca subsp. vesca]